MGASAFMIGSYATQGISAIGGAYAQAQAAKTQAAYQKQQYEANARLAEIQAEDATNRGEKAAVQAGKQTSQVIGSQRASMAAQGIDVNSDSAAEIQADTAAVGADDMRTIRNNAWREAWGYKVQANDMRGRGAMADIAGRSTAANTLLTGGMQFLNAGMRAGYAGISARKSDVDSDVLTLDDAEKVGPPPQETASAKSAREIRFWG